MATGLGTFYYNDYLSEDRDFAAMYLDGFLPLYASLHFGEDYALYSSVKCVGRFRRNHESRYDSGVKNRYTVLVSPAAGFEVVEGNRIVRTEVCYQYEFKTHFYSYQFNIGLSRRFNFGSDSAN